MTTGWRIATLLALTTIGAGQAVAAAGPSHVARPAAPTAHAKYKVKDGEYLPLVADEKKHKTGDVELSVKAKGKKIVFPSGGTCMPNAKAVSAGINQNAPQSINIKHAIPISAKGAFNYSGTVTLTPDDTQSGISYKTRVNLSGNFVLNKKIKTGKTIAATGKFSAPDLCVASTMKKFAIVYEPPGT